MWKQILSVMLAGALAGGAVLSGCDNTVEPPEAKLGAKPGIPPGPTPLNPEYVGKLLLKTNHTVPAGATLAEYPAVATWQLVVRAEWRHEDYFAANPYVDYDAQILGWDAAGVQVASGRTRLYFSESQFANSGSTVVVAGSALDMEQAAHLVDLITQDIEANGAASAELNKTSCWWLALLALMESFRGETLRQRLRGGPVAPARALGTTQGLLEALAHAHAAGILHRDSKLSEDAGADGPDRGRRGPVVAYGARRRRGASCPALVACAGRQAAGSHDGCCNPVDPRRGAMPGGCLQPSCPCS